MNKTFRFLVSIPLALLPVRAAQGKLRLLCYNIHYGQGNDGVHNLERLAAVIKAVDPDLVALQEVDVMTRRSGQVHQAEKLGELTGMSAHYGLTQHHDGGLFGNTVLSKLPLIHTLIQPLPYTEAPPGSKAYPRGFVAVTDMGPGGKPLRFVSTHFQHNSEEDRVAAARAVNESLGTEGDDLPTVLAGDMNALPDSEPLKILLTRWTNVTDDPAAPTAPSKEPKSRIDYIFFRSGDPFESVEAKVIPDGMASDHRPVFAVLQFRAN